MRSTRIFILTVILATIFISCQKGGSSIDTTPAKPKYKVKTYTEDLTYSGTHTVVTYTLTYNPNDLISKMESNIPGSKFVYNYLSDKQFTVDLYNSNIIEIHELFFLNNNSLVDSIVQKNGTDTSTTKFIYNSNNQLVTQKEYYYSHSGGSSLSNSMSYTYDANGNVISSSDSFGSISTFTYYTDLLNTAIVGIPFTTYPTNLVKTGTIKNSGYTITDTHTYTFDTLNRVSTDKDVYDNGAVVIKTYTYY